MPTAYLKNWLPPAFFFILFIGAWEGVIHYFEIPEYLVPPPTTIFSVIVTDFTILSMNTLITMLEAFAGFAIANFFGILLAIVFAHSQTVERTIYPYAIAFKAIPLVAIAPLLILWFGSGILGKMIMAATISFFPILVNATIGLKSIDSEALDLMNSLSASKMQILLKVRFPTSLPFIFSAFKISSTLSVIGAIVAEMAGANQGIGHIIMMASYRMETPTLFAGIFAASLGGIFFFCLIAFIEKQILTWHESMKTV